METVRPFVSVVLPTRDRAGTIRRAVGSVLNQPYSHLELIVVDDASRDATLDLLDAITDRRLRVVRNDRPLGGAAARNRGLEVATGDVIAFQDSDDEWTDDHLDVLVDTLHRSGPAVGVAYGRIEVVGASRTIVPHPTEALVDGDLSAVLPRYNIVGLPSAVVRATALRGVGGFDEALRRYQDWDLFLRLSRRWRFAFTDQIVLLAGAGPGRITTTVDGVDALDALLARHLDLFGIDPQVLTAYRLRAAGMAVRDRRWRSALTDAARALRHPRALTRLGVGRLRGESSPISRPAPTIVEVGAGGGSRER